MIVTEKYTKIIDIICKNQGISVDEQEKILKDKECKYLMLLLMKKYNCLDLKRFELDFGSPNARRLCYSVKRAEEQFLVNYYFRNKYFLLDELITH